MNEKYCSICETKKHISKFYMLRKKRDGNALLSAYCVECHKAIAKQANKEQKERMANTKIKPMTMEEIKEWNKQHPFKLHKGMLIECINDYLKIKDIDNV